MHRAQQLGRYHLLDRIAFGGMAEIYRAKTFDSEGHAHLVAVKRVLGHLAEDPDFIQMLIDEAKIASMILSPNIARVYEFSRAHGDYFIAMEYVDGKDVRSVMERCRAAGRPMPPQHAAWIASEAALALHAAHSVTDRNGQALRVVHRDVSPSNVICSYGGEVKLCDFGIAKATLSKVHTRTGVIKGKVKYMSPEQALGRKLDHRSDIFSLGSVLYEMLTKTAPFMAPNEMDLLIKVRDAKYTPVRELEPSVPVALAQIVDRALTRQRDGRFQSGEEMAAALKGFLLEYMPPYSRSYLGRYLRKTFEKEIERELRLLEEYVVGEPDPSDFGENLIADALGPNAPYSRFTPIAHMPDLEASRPMTVEDPHRRKLRQRAATEPEPAPPSRDVHEVDTKLLERAKRKPTFPGSPGGRDPRELDPAIHESPTRLIDRKKPRR